MNATRTPLNSPLQVQTIFDKGLIILRAFKELEEQLQYDKSQPYGEIHLACTHSFALAALPPVLKQFRQKWPNLHVVVLLGNALFVKRAIRDGLADLGILLDSEELSTFKKQALYHGHYQLFTATNCKKPQRLSFVISEEKAETRLLKNAYQKKFGKELPILMEVSSWEVIANLTEQGLCIGFFPDYIALHQKRGLKPYSLPIPLLEYKIFAIHHQSADLSPNASRLMATLYTYFAKKHMPLPKAVKKQPPAHKASR